MSSHATPTESFADYLRRMRFVANLNQDELAKEIGVSERSIQEWESGRRIPRAKQRRRIAAFFTARMEEAVA